MHGNTKEGPSNSLRCVCGGGGGRVSFRSGVEMKQTEGFAGRENSLCKDRQEVHGAP